MPTLAEATPDPFAQSSPVAPATTWRHSTRALFRFCFAYFGLYVLLTQMLPGMLLIPKLGFAPLDQFAPIRGAVLWTARNLFHLNDVLATRTGSGDRTFDWVECFCILTVAVVTTAAWSYIGRNRTNEDRLHRWFRLFVRFALGSSLLAYGIAKAVPPGQMPPPNLTRLLEPFGNFSPMGVLWASIGAAPPYERFIGVAEAVGGILLFAPRTTTLGALVCLADTIQVFAFNMTYDVPVKLFSFHLILLSLFLLAPEASRLANVIVLGRPAGPSAQAAIARDRSRNRIAVAVQLVFGAWLVGVYVTGAVRNWTRFRDTPTPPLYGIWNVREMSVDGNVRAPLLTDTARWRRVAFDRFAVSFERMDETFVRFFPTVNVKDSTVGLANSPSDTSRKTRFTFRQPSAQELLLDGDMDGHHVHMGLVAMDMKTLTLLNRGFHWIQERPFNR